MKIICPRKGHPPLDYLVENGLVSGSSWLFPGIHPTTNALVQDEYPSINQKA